MSNYTINLPITIDSQLKVHVIPRNEDTDYFIDVDYYSIHLNSLVPFMSRLQFPSMRGILLRTSPHTRLVTMHILKDTDLYSSVCNFEYNLTHHHLTIAHDEHFIQITIQEV